MNMQTALAKVIEQQSLNADEMTAVMRLIMTGQATPAQIGGFLIGLRMKGESVTEVTAAARVMRDLATKIELDPEFLVDTCGTGGDASGTFNVSTASAFVVAAAGGRVAKHGNRSVSSKSGSADVLEAAGVNLNITPAQVTDCINELGVGFLFAQKHHSAMKHAIGPRREMGVRTIFNVLGPLTNPASAPNQVLGVFSAQWLKPLAEVLKALGSRHVMVVNADDGLDEISMAAPTQVAELMNGEITEYRIEPENFGLKTSSLDNVRVNTAEESLALIQAVLNNQASAARDIVVLNAGAAIYVAGLVDSHQAGVERALDVMADGSAAARLDALIEKTGQF